RRPFQGRSRSRPMSNTESFADLFEKTLRSVKEGEVVRGRVLAIDDEHVSIDIGFKSEGMVASWEFMDEDGTVLVSPGDEVDVLLEEAEGEDGRCGVSEEKAEGAIISDGI